MKDGRNMLKKNTMIIQHERMGFKMSRLYIYIYIYKEHIVKNQQ